MYRAKIIANKFGNGEDAIWKVMTSSEEWTDKERSCYGAESVRDTRGKEWDQSQ